MPKKKALKKKTVKNTPEKERHFGVILEDINSNVQLVIERQDILDRKIDVRFDEANKNLDEFKTETRSNFKTVFRHFSTLDGEFQDFKTETRSNFKTVFNHLSSVDNRLSNIENELKSIKTEIKELKTKLDKKADLSRLEVLEKRVAKLEIILQSKLAEAG